MLLLGRGGGGQHHQLGTDSTERGLRMRQRERRDAEQTMQNRRQRDEREMEQRQAGMSGSADGSWMERRFFG